MFHHEGVSKLWPITFATSPLHLKKKTIPYRSSRHTLDCLHGVSSPGSKWVMGGVSQWYPVREVRVGGAVAAESDLCDDWWGGVLSNLFFF